MTENEAIRHLEDLQRLYLGNEKFTVDIEAIGIAIKALEQTRWIPCAERLPEEHEWIGTKAFGTTISDEVYVTFESPKGERFAKHLRFQNGMVSNAVQREIDAFHKGSVPVAWMPLQEPYKKEAEGNAAI